MISKDIKFKLLSGDLMPLVGLGTYQVRGPLLLRDILDYALEAGYRHIDTAATYENEEEIGKALKQLLPKYNLKRKDIFITTKFVPSNQGEKTYKALETSLKKLDLEYIDLYLIHWPSVIGVTTAAAENKKTRDECWQQLVKAVKNGLTRNIGVSNYNVHHLSELLANNHGIKPAVNQVEWHPFCHQKQLLDLCKQEGILLEAYFSLGGTDNMELLQNSEVNEIAQKLGKTPAQVLLKWALQQNICIIPKARSRERIQENINLDFRISEEDMQTLSCLPQKKFSWDPDTVA